MKRQHSRNEDKRNKRQRRRVLLQINSLLGLDWWSAAPIVLIATILGVLGNAITGLMEEVIKNAYGQENSSWSDTIPAAVMTVIATAGVISTVVFGRRRFSAELARDDRVGKVDNAQTIKPKAAVFFVSRPGNELANSKNAEIPDAALAAVREIGRWGEDPAASERANTALESWRMPLTALRHMLSQPGGTFEKIVLIPSAASMFKGKPSDGTIQIADKLRRLIHEVCHQYGHPDVSCHLIGEVLGSDSLLPSRSESQTGGVDLRNGLPFASFERTIEALRRLYSNLSNAPKPNRITGPEILLDITSGMATNSAAAAVFAMEEKERKMFYIDTNSYEMAVYNTLEGILDTQVD